MRKVIFYFDGYNLYYAMRDNGCYDLLWLDLERFCKAFLTESVHDLVAIKFFTAVWPRKPDSEQRQENYFQAVKAHSGALLKVYRGRFHSELKKCPKCSHLYESQTEKRTDVNLATHLLLDSFEENCDIICTVSADSDFFPAIQVCRERYGREVRVFFPPGTHSEELSHSADDVTHLNRPMLQKYQLPDPVVGANGRIFRKPPEWNTPTPGR